MEGHGLTAKEYRKGLRSGVLGAETPFSADWLQICRRPRNGAFRLPGVRNEDPKKTLEKGGLLDDSKHLLLLDYVGFC